MTVTVDEAALERAIVKPPAMPEQWERPNMAAAPVTDDAALDPLERLYQLIKNPPPVPRIGELASGAMAKALDTVCEDVRRIAQETMDRATTIQQEAEGFITVVQESKRVLCHRIEDEATRAYQVSVALREVARLVKGPVSQD